MNLKSIFVIAKKEYMDNIRNFWIIIVSFLFALFTILVSYAGSVFTNQWQDLSLTVAGMSGLVQFFISIVGLMLGYSAIVGEIERGSMSSFLSLPVSRLEILLGKFLGLGAVLTTTIIVGFGISGIIIGLNVSNVDYSQYLVFIGGSLLLGLVFLTLGLFLSSIFKRRTTAMGLAIFMWIFFLIIWQFISGALLLASGSISTTNLSIPDWYYSFQIINPVQSYSMFINLNFESVITNQANIESVFGYPSFITTELTLVVLMIWIITLFILSFLIFKRRDI